MQYKVPQNVDIEDKVIAGLTLRQFMFIMVAGGVGLLEFYAFTGPLSFLFLPMAIITGGIGVAFAFVKINDRPFEIFIGSAMKSLFAPHERVWNKDDDIDIPKHTETPHKAGAPKPKKKSLEEVKSGLERLAMVVDSGGAAGTDDTLDRQSNIQVAEVAEDKDIKDVLAKTEEKQPEVDAIMAEARNYVNKTKKELPVSASASTVSKKEDFQYEKLELADNNVLEETLSKVNKKQAEFAEKIESATVKKFKR